MKTTITIGLLLACAAAAMPGADSANRLERIGFIFGPTKPVAPPKREPPPKPDEGEHEWRRVKGAIFYVSKVNGWEEIDGKVLEVLGSGWYLIARKVMGRDEWQTFSVTNCPKKLVDEDFMPLQWSKVVGQYSYTTVRGSRSTVRLYDCGIPTGPPPPTPEQLATAEFRAVAERDGAAKRKVETEAAMLKFHLVQASNGLAFAQYALAQRYLTGNGVPTDTNLARYWLEKSAAQGSDEAQAALKKLTNSAPASQ